MEFCKEKGIQPHDYKDYETMEFPDFLGTFYSSSNQSPALAANPDTVIAYVPKGTNRMTMTYEDGSVVDWPIINDVSDYNKTQLYATFVGGDRPFSVAHNETIHDGSAVMVVKDSFGNAFIPLAGGPLRVHLLGGRPVYQEHHFPDGGGLQRPGRDL